MTNRQFVGVTVRTWWTLVICIAVSSIGTWAAIDHANANAQRQREISDAQFRHSLIVSNQKFQQAAALSTRQNAYAINKQVCGLRTFVAPTLKSYEAAAQDPTLSASARARNDKRIKTTRAYLGTLVTVPADFDCAKLPKGPP